jgi:hypothetical protein
MINYSPAFELSSMLVVTQTRWRSGLTFGQDVGYYLMNGFSRVRLPLVLFIAWDGSTRW